MASSAAASAATPSSGRKKNLGRIPTGENGVFTEADLTFPDSKSSSGSVVRVKALPVGKVVEVKVDKGGSYLFKRLDERRIRCEHKHPQTKADKEAGKRPGSCSKTFDLTNNSVNIATLRSHAKTHPTAANEKKKPELPLEEDQKQLSSYFTVSPRPSKKHKTSNGNADGGNVSSKSSSLDTASKSKSDEADGQSGTGGIISDEDECVAMDVVGK